MNEKPEDWALLVADQLDATASRLVPGGWNREGAKELRRQHAEIERLRDELLEAEKLAFELSIKSTELHKEIHAALQREV